MPVIYNRSTGGAGDKKPDKSAVKTPTKKKAKVPTGPSPQQQRIWAIAMGVVIVLALVYIGFYLFGGGGPAPATPNGPLPVNSPTTAGGTNRREVIQPSAPPIMRQPAYNTPPNQRPSNTPAPPLGSQNEQPGEAPGIH